MNGVSTAEEQIRSLLIVSSFRLELGADSCAGFYSGFASSTPAFGRSVVQRMRRGMQVIDPGLWMLNNFFCGLAHRKRLVWERPAPVIVARLSSVGSRNTVICDVIGSCGGRSLPTRTVERV